MRDEKDEVATNHVIPSVSEGPGGGEAGLPCPPGPSLTLRMTWGFIHPSSSSLIPP